MAFSGQGSRAFGRMGAAAAHSWVINPSNKPDVYLNFISNRSYNAGAMASAASLLTVTRASSGYVNDSSGNWTSVANNLPRISNLGLLVEEARTNAFGFSQLFTNATWGLSAATLTAGQSSPDGGTNAFLLLDTVANSQHALVNQGTTVTGGATYTFSIFVKSATSNVVQLVNFNAAFTNSFSAIFNAATGTFTTTASVGSGVFVSAGSKIYPNGWTRIWITGHLAVGDTTALPIIYLDAGASVSGTGTGFYIWQAQLEAATDPSSPIVTASAAGTRAADSVTLAETVGTSYSLYAQVTPQTETSFATSQVILSIDDGSGNNISQLFRQGSTGVPSEYGITGASQYMFANIIPFVQAQYETGNYAISFAPSNQNSTFDASTILNNATGNPFHGAATWRIGSNPSGQFFNGLISSIALWKTQGLPNAQLQSLTQPNFNFFVNDGDSTLQTNGSSTGATILSYAAITLYPHTTTANVASSGQYLANAVSQFATHVTPLYKANYHRFVVHILCGTNDIRDLSATAASLFALLQSYVNLVHALGSNAYCVVGTYPLQNDMFTNSTWRAIVQTWNNNIKANWSVSQGSGGLGADGLIDYFADPTVGDNTYAASAYGSGTWSADGLHLVDAGKAILGPLQSAVINALTGP